MVSSAVSAKRALCTCVVPMLAVDGGLFAPKGVHYLARAIGGSTQVVFLTKFFGISLKQKDGFEIIGLEVEIS